MQRDIPVGRAVSELVGDPCVLIERINFDIVQLGNLLLQPFQQRNVFVDDLFFLNAVFFGGDVNQIRRQDLIQRIDSRGAEMEQRPESPFFGDPSPFFDSLQTLIGFFPAADSVDIKDILQIQRFVGRTGSPGDVQLQRIIPQILESLHLGLVVPDIGIRRIADDRDLVPKRVLLLLFTAGHAQQTQNRQYRPIQPRSRFIHRVALIVKSIVFRLFRSVHQMPHIPRGQYVIPRVSKIAKENIRLRPAFSIASSSPEDALHPSYFPVLYTLIYR